MAYISRRKIQQGTGNSRQKRQTYARSADFHEYTSHYHHHEDRLKKRIEQKLYQPVKPCHVLRHILYHKLPIPCKNGRNLLI